MALRHLPQSLRFAWGLQDFLRHPISLEEAEATVRRRMARREESFLLLVERAIFGYPDSPYLPMLKLAGCEFGDIRDMVRNRGVEQTLRTLREAGVYVTYDEYRARAPIVRAITSVVTLATWWSPKAISISTRCAGVFGSGSRVMCWA